MIRVTPPAPEHPMRGTTRRSSRRGKARGLPFSFKGAGRVVAINRLLAAYLVILIVFDVVFGRRANVLLDAVISMPLALVLLLAASRMVRGESLSKVWLRVSGWTCAVLGLSAGLAMWTSLEEPVDVPWAFLAATVAVAMAYAAWYQLVSTPRNVTRSYLIERVRRGYRREAA